MATSLAPGAAVPAANYADLEIRLGQDGASGYRVELRYSRSDSDAEHAPTEGSAQFDLEQLQALWITPADYGRCLSQSLFADPAVRQAFAKARAMTQALDLPLRVRLLIAESSSPLHSLRWETLYDPEADRSLLTRDDVLFSRFLSTDDWRPVHLRPRDELRALVVIADPTDADQWAPGGRSLGRLDVPAELERVKRGLGDIPFDALGSGGTATLANIVTRLRERYDILYLVCHGWLTDPKDGTPSYSWQPSLLLERESGEGVILPAGQLVTHLGELQDRPRLVVLASCQSAGRGDNARSGDEGVLTSLGPRLVQEAGVPAVLAMQGNVPVRLVNAFMPVFFQELQKYGQIDRAVAAARSIVRDEPDSWMPVLFTRLRGGRIWWYTRGFATEQSGSRFELWPGLLESIRKGRCTPILGSDLLEPYIGSAREIGQRLAEALGIPMAQADRDDLTKVAQYIAGVQGDAPLRSILEEDLIREVLRRYGDVMPAEAHTAPLAQLVSQAAAAYRDQGHVEPHHVLAQLPFPIYLTTNPDNLLREALTAAGKQPSEEFWPWIESGSPKSTLVAWPKSIFDADPDHEPSQDNPLVYRLFGHFEEIDSMVLTQDNYFDYLISITRRNDDIPVVVRNSLSNTALLFLGFQLDDWDFRVLFRSILNRETAFLFQRYKHVAVQIDPQEGWLVDPARAREYLQQYFQNPNISIYWGRAQDFINDLRKRWNAKYPQERIDGAP